MSRVKFGDVVKDVKINIDRLNNPYEYYVAGDHMDSEDLTIHRKGCFTTDDVGPAFIRVFKPGQILYGSRRTYLKKIAVADFEGVCANTTFVFETKDPHAFEQRLLPFIMLSKDFTTWSIAKSKGSTNPYVLFSDLADFEFELPPLEEQKVLVDKLWAAYRLKEAYKKLLVATDEMVKSQFIEMFGDCKSQGTLSSLCATFIDGDWIESKDQSDNGIRLIQTGNVGFGFFKGREDKSRYITEETFKKLNCTEVMPGDILISRLPDPIGRACIVPEGIGKAITAVDCTIVRLNATLLPEFLISFSKTALYASQINKIKTGTTRLRVSRGNLGNVIIPIPPIESQHRFAAIAQQADKSKFGDFKSQFIEIFYGMETTPVKDYIDDSFPGEWGTEDKDGNGVKVIRTTNFTNSGKLNLADVVTRSIEDRKVVRKQIKKYDTILERSGGTADNPVGRVVLFEEDNLFLCNNFTQVLRFKDVDPRFAFYALYYFYQTNRTAIRSMGSKTTGIQNLNMSKYLEIGIPNASDEDQKAFVTIAEQADKSESVIQKALVYLNDIQSDELGKIA